MKRVALLVNPLSGKGKAESTGQWLRGELVKRSIEHELFLEWPAAFDGFTEIWIVGGDGTINFFLNKYLSVNLPLAIFKGGTGNDFAWMLYGDCTKEEQLELVLAAMPRPIDAAMCNQRIYVNSSGIGFDGEVLRSIDTIRWLGGHLGYLAVVLRKIFSFKERRFRIKMGDKEYHEKFLLVIVNNSSRTGGGFMVSPEASVTDGKLDIILCKPLTIWQRLRYLPVIEKGKHLGLPFIKFKQQPSIHIEAAEDLYAQLDGELIRAKTFDFKILPARLLIKY